MFASLPRAVALSVASMAGGCAALQAGPMVPEPGPVPVLPAVSPPPVGTPGPSPDPTPGALPSVRARTAGGLAPAGQPAGCPSPGTGPPPARPTPPACGFELAFAPDDVCPGENFRVSGRGVPAHRVSVWLEPREVPHALPAPGNARAPFGVKVGEADVTGSDRRFDLFGRFAEDLGALPTGGRLRLGPDHLGGARDLRAVVYDQAGTRLGDHPVWVGPGCAGSSGASALRRTTLTLTPERPCNGQEAEVRGTGYPAGVTHLEIHVMPDRALGFERSLGTVAVGPDGAFSHRFRVGEGEPLSPYGSYALIVFDADMRRDGIPFQVCPAANE